MPRFLPLILLAGLGLSTAACSTNPATGDSSLAFMTPAEEQKIGNSEHPKTVAEYGGTYDHKELAAYITTVGNKLVAVSERKDQKFTFTLLDSDIVNAFALPGGYVYVTRGLVALTSSEAELAGVIGHEIGHVVARHTAQRDAQSKVAGTLAGVAGLLFGNGASQVAGYGAGAYVQRFSRDQEFESDMLGVRYLARAGYDPSAMAAFLSKLLAISAFEAQKAGQSVDDRFDIMASHPRTVERVADAVSQAKEKPVKDPVVNRDALLNHLDGMMYGADPEKGIVRGQEFLYPPLKLKFAAPASYRFQNGQSEVTATGPNSLSFIFDVRKAKAGQTADEFLRVWGTDFGITRTQAITAMGKPGATGMATVKTENGAQAAVRIIAIRGDGDLVYRFQVIGPASSASAVDTLAGQVVNSLTTLNDAEIQTIQPARIAIVSAATQAEANGLAAKMRYQGTTDKRLFEILNGLSPGEAPKPGVRVKIIQ
ncbi:M48 family metalloprotease [Lacibacterium aquatile]|uniref:M48 family metalloprotease n=1 Tax=Lacibacterium aquatile TaxID=1168082 RepID=A0ABW5DQZ5_9PROT